MIKFLKVSKTFPTGTTALSDISFYIEPKEMVLITGPSGSGKTTIMKLLIKEFDPSKGEISFKDKLLNQLKKSMIPQHRRDIGVVFQDYKLLDDLNVWENIALPLLIQKKGQSEIESRVTDLLKLVSLSEKALMFPSQLSGGEAQRISIARALATGPDFIFADEPTGNLDPNTSLSIIKLLKKINDLGTTILLATHDAVVLDALNKIRTIKIDQGKMLDDSGAKKVKIEKKSDEEAKEKDKEKEDKKSEPVDSKKKAAEPEEKEAQAEQTEQEDEAKKDQKEVEKKPKTRLKLKFPHISFKKKNKDE